LISLLVAAAGTVGVVVWQERQFQRIENALDRGEAEEAFRFVTEYLVEHPDNTRAKALLARVHVAAGQPIKAIELFEKIGPATVADLHALGRSYLMLQRWSDAHVFLSQVIEREPLNADALYEISSCRVRLGMFEQALESAHQLAQIPDNETRGYVFVGTINADLGNNEQAAEAYARVIEHDPQAAHLEIRADEFFLWYGRALLQASNPREAIAQLKRSTELLPSAAAYLELGNAYSEAGDTPQAVTAWQDACDRDPISQDARQALANVALQDGDAARALRWLKPLEDNPNLRSATAYIVQRAHTMLEHEDEADEWQSRTDTLRNKEQIEATIASIPLDDPNSYWARIIRAHRFASAGNWEEAQAIVQPLASRAPIDPFVADLAKAIEQRSNLPPISRIPLKKF
jgi:tetratricopeptide (TPR) repeat protein